MDLKFGIVLRFWSLLALAMPPGAYKGPWEPPQSSVRVHFGTIWSLKCGLHEPKTWAQNCTCGLGVTLGPSKELRQGAFWDYLELKMRAPLA